MRKLSTYFPFRHVLTIAFACLGFFNCFAQFSCPPNIDFEHGDFSNWQCYVGNTSYTTKNIITVYPSAPTPGRHQLLSVASMGIKDPYGGFPVLCPNGSTYTVKLGNNGTGSQAERISYDFTIPVGQNIFSLVYYYAVVFEDPGHPAEEQPRFTARVFDVATNNYVGCNSFEFIATSNLPGFQRSGFSGVWYKSWTPVTMNLSGMGGKTIRVEFTTADCTRGGHFGYAYVAVNTNCSSPVLGAFYCPGSPSTTLNAPYGYQSYTWFDNNFTQLGTTEKLVISPPPPTNTVYAVEVIPYQGFGCKDTLYATIKEAKPPTAVAGNPLALCPGSNGQLGTTAVRGNTYSWLPATGLSSATVANPVFTAGTVSQTTSINYVISVLDPNTGCTKTDSVLITNYPKPTAAFTINNLTQCINENKISIAHNNSSNYSFTWNYGDGTTDNTSTPPDHIYKSTGTFPVLLSVLSQDGCTNTSSQNVVINDAPLAIAGKPLDLCEGATGQLGSATAPGDTYSWSPSTYLNSGSIANPVVTVPVLPNKQTVNYVLTVTNAAGCRRKDSVIVSLTQKPKTSFTINSTDQCIDNNSFIFTNNNSSGIAYTWNFGDNANSTAQSPSPHHYAKDGAYTVMLSAVDGPGCTDSTKQTINVHPLPSGILTASSNIICETVPVTIKAAKGFANYSWYYNGISLNTPHDSIFNALQGGAYSVDIVSQYGCKSTTNAVQLNLVKKAITDFGYEKYCAGLPVQFINRTTTTGSGNVDYSWKFGNNDASGLSDPVEVFNTPGPYLVQLTATPQQCPNIATIKERTILIEVPKKGISYEPKNAVVGKALFLQARTFGIDYEWAPATYLNNTITPSTIFQGNTEQKYTIKITAASGCATVDTQMVRIFNNVDIYVPKGFTPNGDGQNDRMYPFLVGIQQLKYFRIINRWGVVVYQSVNDLPGWDGMYKGQQQPMDGYVWEAEAIDIYGNPVKRSGNFTLIR